MTKKEKEYGLYSVSSAYSFELDNDYVYDRGFSTIEEAVEALKEEGISRPMFIVKRVALVEPVKPEVQIKVTEIE